jgi:hypothetical protein
VAVVVEAIGADVTVDGAAVVCASATEQMTAPNARAIKE